MDVAGGPRSVSTPLRRVLGLCAAVAVGALCGRAGWAAFEDTFAGARALAMGGAHIAIVDDTDSMAANPAGLARLPDSGRTRLASASYGGLYLGLSDGNRVAQSYLAYATSGRTGTGVGVAWKRLQGGHLYSEDRVSVAFASRVHVAGDHKESVPRLALGIQGSLLNWDTAPTVGAAGNVLEDLNGPARVGLTLGATYTLTASESLRVPIGVTFRHVNEPNVASSSSQQTEPVHSQTSFGIGAVGARTAWALDIEMSRRNVDVRTGLEWQAHPETLFLRAGLRLEGLALGTNLTFGAGVSLKPHTRVDYAFWLPIRNVTETGGGHRISVTYAF